MKKINKFISFIFWITLFYSFSFAEWLSWILWGHSPDNLIKTPWWSCDNSWEIAVSIIAKIVDVILFLSWIIAMFMVIYWGFRYITYFWSEDTEEEAKKTILYWLLWLFLVIISVLLLDNIKDFIYFLFWQWWNISI